MKSEEIDVLKQGDIIKLKKEHPCGTNRWELIRIGMDVKLKCIECQNYISLSRKNFNKSYKETLERRSDI
ncbi:MAG: DUF951 domain-containing protein [Halarsenatibacteraceae bacterium]